MSQNVKSFAKIAAVSAAAFAGTGIIMNTLVLTRASKVISDKKWEKEYRKNPVDTTLPKEILRKENSDWYNGKEKEHIVIDNRSGKILHAYIIYSQKETKKWAVCLHGYTSDPAGMADYAHEYNNMGFNVLLPVLRGHNISEQKHIGMGWLDRLDVVDWINYLVKREPTCNIVIHGVSMGAATAMMTTGEELPENVKCCVADCGYSSVWDEFSNQMKVAYHLPDFPVLAAADAVSKTAGGYGFKEASSVKQLQKSKTPTIFIHGEKDTFVPYRMLDLNYNAAACEKMKVSIPDAEHAESAVVHPELYWKYVKEFIAKYM